jgi:hypothetical protein
MGNKTVKLNKVHINEEVDILMITKENTFGV